MSTISKALTLLDAISRLEKEAGLSDIARHCGLDKATARRFLVELEKHGFVEQDMETRRYRLGGAPELLDAAAVAACLRYEQDVARNGRRALGHRRTRRAQMAADAECDDRLVADDHAFLPLRQGCGRASSASSQALVSPVRRT